MQDIDLNEIVVFGTKKLGDVVETIYNNSADRKEQIDGLINIILSNATSFQDVVSVSSMLKDYFDAGAKNDEQLIKLVQIVQRIVTAQKPSGGTSGLDLDANMLQELREAASAEFDTLRESTMPGQSKDE